MWWWIIETPGSQINQMDSVVVKIDQLLRGGKMSKYQSFCKIYETLWQSSIMISIFMTQVLQSSFRPSCISMEKARSIFFVEQCFIVKEGCFKVARASSKSVWILEVYLNVRNGILISGISQAYLSALVFCRWRFQIIILKRDQCLWTQIGN